MRANACSAGPETAISSRFEPIPICKLLSHLLGGVKLGRESLSKGTLKGFDSGQEAVSDLPKGAGVDRYRRSSHPRADPRLSKVEAIPGFCDTSKGQYGRKEMV